MKPWYCLDCTSVVDLDRHGRCETCGSEAVCVATPAPSGIPSRAELLAILESMWEAE